MTIQEWGYLHRLGVLWDGEAIEACWEVAFVAFATVHHRLVYTFHDGES